MDSRTESNKPRICLQAIYKDPSNKTNTGGVVVVIKGRERAAISLNGGRQGGRPLVVEGVGGG